jgi:hypothetical protein
MTLVANPPTTAPGVGVVTSHSLTMYGGSDGSTPIGVIQSWHPQSSRTATHVYEINSDTSGAPVDLVPGNVTGLTITVNRFDVFNSKMEQAFGSKDMAMLTDQTSPFTVKEVWKFVGQSDQVFYYTGCWFSQLGRTMSSTDDRIVKVDATITYLACIKRA